MRRAAIFMADAAGQRVRAVGSYGASRAHLDELRPTLLGTPIAQRALVEDAVIVVSEGVEEAVPADYADELGITTLVCAPLSASGRAYGVICCDRGGTPFELSDGERHLLWTLGKTAALVATARITTRQQERARRLAERLELAREIHDRVMQRLFAVSLSLSAHELPPAERERCRHEMEEALADLRRALRRPLAGTAGRGRGGPERLLSAREQEVLGLIGGGATNREIAADLQLSPHTIKEHVSAVYRKLGARNRADAVRKAQRIGLLG
jgi:DNA-binding NarL/FixJ family response regulator